MNNLLSCTLIGESHSQATVQVLLSVAFARELFPRSEGRGSIEAMPTDFSLRFVSPLFPRSEGRGSIEAVLSLPEAVSTYLVSTFGRTWLH